MISHGYLRKLKKFNDSDNDGINFTQSLLYAIALGEKLSPEFYKNRKVAQAFAGLRRYKFVRHIKGENGAKYALTPKGEKRLQIIVIDEIEIKPKKQWDGKWRLVMYDLPIRFKKARDAFRWKLKDLGFVQLQKSAWVYPYPCEEELLFVADFYGVRTHIEILEATKILDDKKLRAHFCL